MSEHSAESPKPAPRSRRLLNIVWSGLLLAIASISLAMTGIDHLVYKVGVFEDRSQPVMLPIPPRDAGSMSTVVVEEARLLMVGNLIKGYELKLRNTGEAAIGHILFHLRLRAKAPSAGGLGTAMSVAIPEGLEPEGVTQTILNIGGLFLFWRLKTDDHDFEPLARAGVWPARVWGTDGQVLWEIHTPTSGDSR